MPSSLLFYVLIGFWRRDIHVRQTEQSSQADNVKGCDQFAKLHRTLDTLEFEQNNSQVAVQKWLEFPAKLRFLDVRQPTCVVGTTEQLQAVVFLPAASWILAFRASGIDGVFVRPCFERA